MMLLLLRPPDRGMISNMQPRHGNWRFLFTLSAIVLCGQVVAAQPGSVAQPQHHFIFMQYSPGNRIVELSTDGKVLWEHPVPGLAVMFQLRKNGNVIYAYGGSPTGVQEVDRDHKVVWDYHAKCEQVLGFDALPNGNVLVGEQGPCQAVEVNRHGEEVRARLHEVLPRLSCHLFVQLDAQLGGSLSGEHGIGADKACSMTAMFSEDDLDVMKRVRSGFDTHGLCNPGKIYPTPRLCGDKPGIYVAHASESEGGTPADHRP